LIALHFSQKKGLSKADIKKGGEREKKRAFP